MEAITINVNFSASPELRDLLSPLAACLGNLLGGGIKHMKEIPVTSTQEVNEASQEHPSDAGLIKEGETISADAPGEQKKTDAIRNSNVILVDGIIPIEGDEYTAVDVRAAIDRTRQRLEGEDYKNQPDSELYRRWHKPLTAWFVDTARMFGADRPSDLPDHDSRYRFIGACERCMIENGVLCEATPF